MGTDERDVWAACFDDWRHGIVHVVFLSPTGMILGFVRVPAEVFVDDEGAYRHRTSPDIERWWSAGS